MRFDEWNALQDTYDTPSVSPFGLTAPPEVEPRALRAALVPFNRVLGLRADIRPTTAAAKPPTGRLAVDPYSGVCKTGHFHDFHFFKDK